MSVQTAVFGAAQILGGVILAPLLPGLVQSVKARLQGRVGPSPVQPYRELRRLWGKSGIEVEHTHALTRMAPSAATGAVVVAVLLVPAGSVAPDWGVGHDALALAGVLAVARCVIAVAAMDTRSGFAVQGVARDLTLAVAVDAVLVLSFTVAALEAGTTDLTQIVAATAGTTPWESPTLALGTVAFFLVVVAETGRQPVDNPDTHLELTMIHESSLLEVGGRDLAYLQWAAAARHWLVLVVAASLFLPHPADPWLQLAVLPLWLAVLCVSLALVETLVAKMRILLVPRLLGVGAGVAMLGILTWLVESGA